MKKILIQLDGDAQASVFDGVVAVDSDVDHLFRHHGVLPDQVRELVYGAIFTRGGDDLRHTAIFVGGSDVTLGERLLEAVTSSFFGPMRVSVLFDANGANTTAAAAVIAAERHLSLDGCHALVLGATGPVGRRSARLLATAGATVRIASRSLERAQSVVRELAEQASVSVDQLSTVQAANADETAQALKGVQVVIAAGAPGVQLLSEQQCKNSSDLSVAIDLNAVPPLGIEGCQVTDKAMERNGVVYYGAIGVGGTKMKIHRSAIRKLFTANDLMLDAEEVFQLGRELERNP